MRRRWILWLVVVALVVVVAAGTPLYIVHTDLITLSRELAMVQQRTADLEKRQTLLLSAVGMEWALEVASYPLPELQLVPSSPSLVQPDLARRLNIDEQKRAEINRLITEFFSREAKHLAATTRTETGKLHMTIRADDAYRRAREQRWRTFLTETLGSELTAEQLTTLTLTLSMGAEPASRETVEIRW
jgi:hypothetical protein